MEAVESTTGQGTTRPLGIKKDDVTRFTLAGIASMGGATGEFFITTLKIRISVCMRWFRSMVYKISALFGTNP